MATIKDVAKLAGVGIATVSRVINNSGYVKTETREKIEKAVKDLSFKPNEIARNMTLQKNDIVAFILPNSTHLFFGELLYSVEEELFKYGYKVMLCNSSEKIEKELVYLNMLRNKIVDAVILLTNNDVESYLDKSLPIISFDRRFTNVPFVASDNYGGGVLAANYLISKGCKKFMFIGDDAQGIHSHVMTEVSKRRVGFIETLEQHGFHDIINIEYPLGDYVVTKEMIKDLVKDYRDVDGIFTVSDAVAHSIVQIYEEMGKNVPNNVKVIGYDGGRSFLNFGKKITSINQDTNAIAIKIRQMIVNYRMQIPNVSQIVPVTISKGDTA
jgi:DNA-binding LacI/PurR family transcriptional regulator